MNIRLVVTIVLAIGLAAAVMAADQTDKLPASGGDITIAPIMHSSVQIEYAGKVIQVDPVAKYDDVELPLLGKFDALKPADLILITDIHPENLDVAEVSKLRKSGATVVIPAAVATEAGTKIAAPTVVMANGDTKTVADVNIEAVAMYNVQHGPAPGQVYHPKGRGNGYIVTLGGKLIRLIPCPNFKPCPFAPEIDARCGLDDIRDIGPADTSGDFDEIEFAAGVRPQELRMGHSAYETKALD